MGTGMKRLFGGLVAGIAIAFLTVSPAQAAPATECTGTITGGTTGSLIVPEGETCTLEGVTVNGNIRIEAGGALITDDSTINGNVRGNGARTVQLIDTDVVGTGTTGNITLTGTTGKIVIGSEGCRVDPAVGNNITLIDNEGNISICYMTVGETINVQGTDDGRIGIHNNTVGNSLIVQDNTGARITLTNNNVGVSGGGSINVDNNTTTLKLNLTNNHSANALNCTGNVLPPTGSGNTADNGGHGQCADLA
ncbi:MAG: hypothetical protein M3313_09550 [Actinomycetota bacterium]|nr:hypothetical protein [Actinomycetota bacterium]